MDWVDHVYCYLNLAEERFISDDLQEALRLAHMAKNLNPQLDNMVDNVVAAYNIHAAAELRNKNGDINWYYVLGLEDFNVERETIKKMYKKLALMVHPDKNSSEAADGAFKLIREAWNVLSEISTREPYDLRCGWGPSHQTAQNSSEEEEGDIDRSKGKRCPYRCKECGEWCGCMEDDHTVVVCSKCDKRSNGGDRSTREEGHTKSESTEDSSPEMCPWCDELSFFNGVCRKCLFGNSS